MMVVVIPAVIAQIDHILALQIVSVSEFCDLSDFSIDCSDPNCQTCTISGCQKCDASYLIFADNGECYPNDSCPTGTYSNSTNCIRKK